SPDMDVLANAAGGPSSRINYLAPEQLRGEPACTASDVYAFGTVAYILFTGHPAFAADAGIAELLTLESSDASELRPDLPTEVVQLIDGSRKKDPGPRPTMKSVVEPFSGALGSEHVPGMGSPGRPPPAQSPPFAAPEPSPPFGDPLPRRAERWS